MVAFRTPATPAHSAPPTMPPTRTIGSRMGDGSELNLIPIAVHAIEPASSWPSAPMLNRPARNGSATAMPAVMSGMTNTIVFEIWRPGFSPPAHPMPKPPQTSAA